MLLLKMEVCAVTRISFGIHPCCRSFTATLACSLHTSFSKRLMQSTLAPFCRGSCLKSEEVYTAEFSPECLVFPLDCTFRHGTSNAVGSGWRKVQCMAGWASDRRGLGSYCVVPGQLMDRTSLRVQSGHKFPLQIYP